MKRFLYVLAVCGSVQNGYGTSSLKADFEEEIAKNLGKSFIVTVPVNEDWYKKYKETKDSRECVKVRSVDYYYQWFYAEWGDNNKISKHNKYNEHWSPILTIYYSDGDKQVICRTDAKGEHYTTNTPNPLKFTELEPYLKQTTIRYGKNETREIYEPKSNIYISNKDKVTIIPEEDILEKEKYRNLLLNHAKVKMPKWEGLGLISHDDDRINRLYKLSSNDLIDWVFGQEIDAVSYHGSSLVGVTPDVFLKQVMAAKMTAKYALSLLENPTPENFKDRVYLGSRGNWMGGKNNRSLFPDTEMTNAEAYSQHNEWINDGYKDGDIPVLVKRVQIKQDSYARNFLKDVWEYHADPRCMGRYDATWADPNYVLNQYKISPEYATYDLEAFYTRAMGGKIKKII
jgi:hypothetical protein